MVDLVDRCTRTADMKRHSLWESRLVCAAGLDGAWKNIQFSCTLKRAEYVKAELKKIRRTLPHRYSLRVVPDTDSLGYLTQARCTGPRK